LVAASLRHIFDEARDFASSPCVLPLSPANRPRRAAQPRLRHRPRPKGWTGRRAAASRTPRGRRCAAGLRPVLDPAARSHGMAAAREREQRGS